MKPINRRNFIKTMIALGGIPLLGAASRLPVVEDLIRSLRTPVTGVKTAEKEVQPEKNNKQRTADGFGTTANPENKFGMVIDVGACIGCRTCQWACKEENNISDIINPPWIEIFRLHEEEGILSTPSIEELKAGATTSYTESPEEGQWYLPVQCNHCENPPCVKVCPTGATYRAEDGLVLMDYDKCIGCRFCVVACPYSNRRFNWEKPDIPKKDINSKVPVRPVGVAEKCTFCVHRTRLGKLPRCVIACPMRARHFGNFADPESEVSLLLEESLGFRLLEELNTEPRIFYITRGKKFRGS